MKHPPRILIAVVVIAGLLVGGYFIERGRAAQRSKLSGFFESQPAELSSRIGGRVVDIRVREGDVVAKNLPLLILEAAPNREETEAKRAQAQQASAAREEVEAGPRQEEIARQQSVVAEAEAALTKLRNGALPEEIAAARNKLKQAEANLAKAVAGSRPQEKEQARAAEREARAKLAQVERGLTPEEKAQFRARRDQAAAQAQLAEREVQRAGSLYDDGAISKQQLDKTKTDRDTARDRLREAEQALKRALEGTPREELEQARQAYRQADAALKLVLAGTRREDISAARAEASAARAQYKLVVRGPRAEDISAAEARVNQARAILSELRAGSRKEDIEQARAAERAAQSSARASQSTLDERTVRSPIDGIVERILVSRGDLITAGMPVIRMSDPRDIWIRVYVPENRLSLVSPRDTADIAVDGVTGLVTGVVESIATQGEFTPANLQTPEERGRQVFAVRIRLARADARIKAGMFATVRRVGRWTP